jgi:hypothetical protein
MMLATSQKQRYWELVQGALKMAGAPIALAASLQYRIDNLPEDQQELFYHAEPLDVAKDLSGIERWSDEQIRAYIEQSSRASQANHELEPAITVQPKSNFFRFVSAFIFACSVAFGALLLLVVSLQQTGPLARTLSILAGGIGALGISGTLVMLFGLPAYNDTLRLQERFQHLEEEMKQALAQNQRLEREMKQALAQNQRLEKEMKQALNRRVS